MGRNKKNIPLAKTHDIHLRVTEDMYKAIETDALKAKLSVADYCRQAINSHHIPGDWQALPNDLHTRSQYNFSLTNNHHIFSLQGL